MARAGAALTTYLGVSGTGREAMILRLLIELGAQVVGAEEGSLLVLDEGRQQLVFAMTAGSRSSEKVLIGQRVPLGKGITGLAAQTHEVQIGAPTFRTRQARRRAGAATEPEAVLAAPMLIEDRLIGVLTAVSFAPGKRFTSGDALLYGRIAAVAGVVVDQSRQLHALAALQGCRAARDGGRLDREMVRAVTRLSGARPRAKQQVAELLVAVAALVEA
ncbi:MAG: GAF domain-containing protein [Candidatus Methylomirabilales bacterium]